ncbi:hypothetical protein [Sphingobacterium paucimobilis]|uniref:Uncharacterized protein n=1 Tax=Sphingobacterium paucimobilis HER1398 TaxID=1346330 RepID=U2HWN1_9SPHI|nr:hypothetical protein [Sphingobacterium paucimobilis]ERJ59947.1 hypothetical protein M472_14350 [Sphingobacterium paucimobilis HER1398]
MKIATKWKEAPVNIQMQHKLTMTVLSVITYIFPMQLLLASHYNWSIHLLSFTQRIA